MTDRDDEHQQNAILNLVDNPVVARSDPVQLVFSFEFSHSARAGIEGKGVDATLDLSLLRSGKLSESASCRSGKLDIVASGQTVPMHP